MATAAIPHAPASVGPMDPFNPFTLCQDPSQPPAWTHGEITDGAWYRLDRLEALVDLLSCAREDQVVERPDVIGRLIQDEARVVRLLLNRALQLLDAAVDGQAVPR